MHVLIGLTFLLLVACAQQPVTQEEPENIIAVGFGAMNQFSEYSEARQHLLAVRAAKLDAYRNLAEDLYGTHLRSQTSIKDMAIQSDHYRSYVEGLIRGAKLRAVTMKQQGIYEAEIEMPLSPTVYQCLRQPTDDCRSHLSQEVDVGPINAMNDNTRRRAINRPTAWR